MDCQHTTDCIQDWLDGELTGEALAEFRTHLDRCPRCRARAEDWQALQGALRGLPAPAPPPDLTERLWAMPRRRMPTASLAAAASLVLALVALPWMLPGGDPATSSQVSTPSVQLPLNVSENLQLALSSPSNLEQVQLTLVLPDHLELQGFPEQRVVSWKTDLLAGDNRLTLPLKARAIGEGELIARLKHDGKTQELRVRVTTGTDPSAMRRPDKPHSFTSANRPIAPRSAYHA